MINKETRELFELLRKAIPAIPADCTRLELHLDIEAPPRLSVDFIVRDRAKPQIDSESAK